MGDSKEFLNPSSMLTPGLAGGMTMAITNVLSGQFGIAPGGTAYAGLGLSFLFGLLVWVNEDVPRVKKAVYYVLNSLVIFVVAVGSNTVGLASAKPEPRNAAIAVSGGMFISSAVAQPAQGWCCIGTSVAATSVDECRQRSGKFFSTEAAAKQSCEPPKQTKEGDKTGPFFRPWIKADKG
jgi:hypothetical protein